jgi:CBS domain-containing protein
MGHIRKEAPVSAAGTPVAQVMTARPVTTRPDMRLDKARDLLQSRGLSRVPVVDDDGRPVGMLSVTNLSAAGNGRRIDSPPQQQQKVCRDSLEQGLRVADVMKCHVVAVPESASIAQAAEIFVAHGLHGAPVTSLAGVVVGFLSSSDVLAWLAGLR